MNVTPSVFQQIGLIFQASKARKDAENVAFLAFLKELIEKTDGDIAAAVGRVSVDLVKGTAPSNAGIILSVEDYIFWKNKFADGYRFKKPVEQVKSDILAKLAKAAEDNNLTADERKSLLALLTSSD